MRKENPIEYRLEMPPRYVGAWRVGGIHGIRFNLTKRPGWLARIVCKWLLGWRWVDADEN